MNALQRSCRISVEIALLLVVLLAALAPFHAAKTTYYPIRSIDAWRASIVGDMGDLAIGDKVPIYRFSSVSKAPIGSAYIESISATGARILADPRTATQTLGRQGVIEGGYATLGSEHGFAAGDHLYIFRDGMMQGQAEIIETEEERSLLALPPDIGELEGVVVSEYEFPTVIAVFDAPVLVTLELMLIACTIGAYGLVFAFTGRSPMLLLGAYVRSLRFPRTTIVRLLHIAAGIPFSWFIGTMPLYLLSYLASEVALRLGDTLYLRPTVDAILPFSIGATALAYYIYLAWTRRSPVLDVWKVLSYRGTGVVREVSFRRGLINWALHLIIVYAFGITLIGFLQADIEAVRRIGWPAPSLEALFELLKYSLWSLTVIGCLIGYGYSVVSILWGSYIRTLDFTVVGWLTNGFCYPMLGVVIWQMVPSFTGPYPIITDGPLLWLTLFLGLFLNFLYMLSIWNLWTMFDLMADKGVRRSFFYGVIRHPNYTLEAAMFFATEIVGLTMGVQWLAISMFFFLYWIRSEREDNFMQYSNPEYAEYQKQTPYKFIPGVY